MILNRPNPWSNCSVHATLGVFFLPHMLKKQTASKFGRIGWFAMLFNHYTQLTTNKQREKPDTRQCTYPHVPIKSSLRWMEMLPLLWPRNTAVACESPCFHSDCDSGYLHSNSSPQPTVNQVLLVSGNAVWPVSVWLRLTCCWPGIMWRSSNAVPCTLPLRNLASSA